MGCVDPCGPLCKASRPPEAPASDRNARHHPSLEDALRHFERGVALARDCQISLKQAEQKVEILLQKSVTAVPEPFEPDDA
jgi:hypothetical protein